MRVAGLGIADARQLRIAVEDGALAVRRPGRPPHVVGSVGTVRRLVWLDEPQTVALLGRRRWSQAPADTQSGAVLALTDAGVGLAFYVGDYVPWGGDQGERRESSGAVDLARSLGLVLEAARPEDLPPRRQARAVLVAPRHGADTTALGALALTLVAGVLAFLSWPHGGSGLGLVLNLVSVVAIAPVLTLLVRHRRRFESLVGAPTDPDGRTVYPFPREGVGDLATQLQLGARDVVLVDPGGKELWLPGPAAAGVTSCVIGDRATCLLDARGILLLALDTDQVVPDDASRARLEKAAESVGISVTTDPFLVPASGSPLDLRHTTDEPGLSMTEWERGRIAGAVDVLVPLAGVIQLVGAVAAAYALPPWGYLALAGSAAWLGVRLWTGLRYRRWRTGIRRKGAM